MRAEKEASGQTDAKGKIHTEAKSDKKSATSESALKKAEEAAAVDAVATKKASRKERPLGKAAVAAALAKKEADPDEVID